LRGAAWAQQCEGCDLNAWTTGRLTLLAVTPLALRRSLWSRLAPFDFRALVRLARGFAARSSRGLTPFALAAHEGPTGADLESALVDRFNYSVCSIESFAREDRSSSRRDAPFASRSLRDLADLPALLRGAAWARQCEGCDLNAWTPTGADLESAAVSRLGYPRTHPNPVRSGG